MTGCLPDDEEGQDSIEACKGRFVGVVNGTKLCCSTLNMEVDHEEEEEEQQEGWRESII